MLQFIKNKGINTVFQSREGYDSIFKKKVIIKSGAECIRNIIGFLSRINF
jgi:hypothetical protein